MWTRNRGPSAADKSGKASCQVEVVYTFIWLEEGRYQYDGYIMLVKLNIIEYGWRTPELPNARLDMKQDNDSIEYRV